VTTVSRRTAIIVLTVCLVISICLNLFAAGAWVAARWLDRPFASAASTAMQPYPPSLRREIRQRIGAERGPLLAALAELRDARQTMFNLMRADPLDREALQRAMTDVRVKTTALQALLQTAVAESLAQTPPSERQKIEPPGLGFGLLRRDF
jgi:uncharacterized membrane protein